MPRLWRTALWRGNRRNGPRQQRQRIERQFDCTWLSTWGEEKSRISSLSPTGCYIDSRFTTPAEGTPIQDITITLPTGSLTVQGTVLDAMRGVGFAVRFTDVDKDTRNSLSVLIRDLQTMGEDRIGGCFTPAGR
jgi:PilZ domain-containing protein